MKKYIFSDGLLLLLFGWGIFWMLPPHKRYTTKIKTYFFQKKIAHILGIKPYCAHSIFGMIIFAVSKWVKFYKLENRLNDFNPLPPIPLYIFYTTRNIKSPLWQRAIVWLTELAISRNKQNFLRYTPSNIQHKNPSTNWTHQPTKFHLEFFLHDDYFHRLKSMKRPRIELQDTLGLICAEPNIFIFLRFQ